MTTIYIDLCIFEQISSINSEMSAEKLAKQYKSISQRREKKMFTSHLPVYSA